MTPHTHRLEPRAHRRLPLLAVLLAALTLLTGCSHASSPGVSVSTATPAPAPPSGPQVVRVGSANFPENRLLAEIYATGLQSRGITVERRFSVGTREIYIPALQDGSIDLVPEYTGNLLRYLDPQATATTSPDINQELQRRLPAPLAMLTPARARDADAVVVTAAVAAQYRLSTINDLAPLCSSLTFGGPPEFQQRPYGTPGLAARYGCSFGAFRPLDAGGPQTVQALKDNTVQVADLFTTDPAINDNGFVVLGDPKSNFPAQDVVPLTTSAKASDPRISGVLNNISAHLGTDTLTNLNRQLAAPDHPAPSKIAYDWLVSVGVLPPR